MTAVRLVTCPLLLPVPHEVSPGEEASSSSPIAPQTHYFIWPAHTYYTPSTLQEMLQMLGIHQKEKEQRDPCLALFTHGELPKLQDSGAKQSQIKMETKPVLKVDNYLCYLCQKQVIWSWTENIRLFQEKQRGTKIIQTRYNKNINKYNEGRSLGKIRFKQSNFWQRTKKVKF